VSDEAPVRPGGGPARTAHLRVRTALLVSAAGLAAADLAVKTVAEALLSNDSTIELGPLNIRLLYNRGVAFSLGADLPTWAVIAATGVIITALLWYTLTTAPSLTGPSRAGAALLLGGALGNFIDRLDGQGVVDYLHTGWFPTFNLADIFVTTGVGLLVLGTLFVKPAAPDRAKTEP
jgi:signal peptidase II